MLKLIRWAFGHPIGELASAVYTALEVPMSGRDLRDWLASRGYPMSAGAFYRSMSKLETLGRVVGYYEARRAFVKPERCSKCGAIHERQVIKTRWYRRGNIAVPT